MVVLDGIRPKENSSLKSAVIDAVNSDTDIDLKLSEISHCMLLGSLDNDNGKPRPIRVKFHDKKVKKIVMKSKSQLRRNKSKIFVKEHLTPRNNNIFYTARDAKRYKIFHHVWTDAGRIWATVTENGQPLLLRDKDVIQSEIEAAIGKGIEPVAKMEAEPEERPPRAAGSAQNSQDGPPNAGHLPNRDQPIGSRLQSLAGSGDKLKNQDQRDDRKPRRVPHFPQQYPPQYPQYHQRTGEHFNNRQRDNSHYPVNPYHQAAYAVGDRTVPASYSAGYGGAFHGCPSQPARQQPAQFTYGYPDQRSTVAGLSQQWGTPEWVNRHRTHQPQVPPPPPPPRQNPVSDFYPRQYPYQVDDRSYAASTSGGNYYHPPTTHQYSVPVSNRFDCLNDY